MCGIFGYIGNKNAASVILKGLENLQYRGYDSAGIVVFDGTKPQYIKKKGKVNVLKKILKKNPIQGFLGIGHSRWATHGTPSDKNAHPFWDCKKEIWLVHNGIIENYLTLKKQLLKKGHQFSSETDTEVIVHLLEDFYKGDLKKATEEVVKMLVGAYALAFFSIKEPDKIIAVRVSSPLLAANKYHQGFLSSDPTALTNHTKKAVVLNDGEMAIITKDKVDIYKLNGEKSKVNLAIFKDIPTKVSKAAFKHFMLKEIYEIPESIKNSIRGRIINNKIKLGGLESVSKDLKKIQELKILGCGSAYYAALYGKYIIEELVGILCEADIASEFRYRQTPFLKKDKSAALFISQSGETADSLASLKKINEEKILSLGIVNVVGSSIARETKAGIYNHIGPEIAVVTTKAMISQMILLNLFALYLTQLKNIEIKNKKEIIKAILNLPSLTNEILKESIAIKKLAKKYFKYNGFAVFGRKFNYPAALEGALKLKETAYINASGYSGGEFKHGAIALIDKNFPSIAIIPQDSLYKKMFSNVQEIKTRKGPVIAITTKGNQEIKKITDDIIYIPQTLELFYPVLSIMVLQLFAYYCADFKKLEIDKPRNLAKSVTVE